MKYGDYENVTKDGMTLEDIQSRQGSTILMEAIADHIGDCAARFKLSDTERIRLLHVYLAEFKELILERI